MHRQSLGSPPSKLQCHGVLFAGVTHNIIDNNNSNSLTSEDHRKDRLTSCSAAAADDGECKSQKSYSPKSVLVSSSTRLVHLIPVIMFVCFVVLYLFSHDPSRKDLAQFGGFHTHSAMKIAIDSIGVDDNVGGRSVVIGSMRNLQQQEWNHLHRKFRH